MERGRHVHSGSRGFFRARVGFAGFIRFRLCSLRAISGRRVRSGSRGFTRARLGVAGFIRFPVGSLGCAYGSTV